jgi:hypothetical protein
LDFLATFFFGAAFFTTFFGAAFFGAAFLATFFGAFLAGAVTIKFLFIDKFNFLNSRSRTQDEIIGPDFFQRHFVKCLRISTTSANEAPRLPIKPSPCIACLGMCLHGPDASLSRELVASEKIRKYLPFFGTDFFAAAAFAI